MSTWYDRLTLLRQERKLSINKLEQSIDGISRGSLSKWVDHKPTIDKIKLVADFFEVSVDYLLGNTDIKKEPADNGKLEDATIKEIADITSAMTQEQREALLAYLRTLQ